MKSKALVVLEREMQEEQVLIQKKQKALEQAPKGRLVATKNGNQRTEYRHAIDGARVYLSAGEADKISALAQKRYDASFLKVLEHNYSCKENAAKWLSRQWSYDSAGSHASEALKFTWSSYEEELETAKREWQEKPFYALEFHEEEKTVETKRGELVRSKSEKIIADLLYDLGLAYKYEKRLYVHDRCYYPDFTIYDPVHDRELLLEHFGGMDDGEYAKNMVVKINDYERAGYEVGKTFFYTLETRTVHANMRRLERELRDYFFL